MDCVQSYFSYRFATKCGIPAVTLEGTAEDWERVHDRVGRLGVYGLGWWVGQVGPITAEFVKAAKGDATPSFWKGIFKEEGGSGGFFISGWLVRLLPYLKQREGRQWRTGLRNFLLGRPSGEEGTILGLTHEQLPSSVSQVPFVWDHLGTPFEYKFVAGVTAVSQDAETGAVRPRIGWAVRPAAASEPRNSAAEDFPSS
jgi:hypothetical protein